MWSSYRQKYLLLTLKIVQKRTATIRHHLPKDNQGNLFKELEMHIVKSNHHQPTKNDAFFRPLSRLRNASLNACSNLPLQLSTLIFSKMQKNSSCITKSTLGFYLLAQNQTRKTQAIDSSHGKRDQPSQYLKELIIRSPTTRASIPCSYWLLLSMSTRKRLKWT